MDTIAPASQPRPGTSRRAQHKRTLHARFPLGGAAAVTAAPPAKRMKLPVRRAATAPAIQPLETDSSDMSSHTTDGETLNKASSCPPLADAMLDAEAAPLTPRIEALVPAAAVPAPSMSPPHEAATAAARGQPESASSETVSVAAVADTAATAAAAASPEVAISASLPALPAISAPLAVGLRSAPWSPPATPNLATPPPETPRSKARTAAGRPRGSRAASVEPRAGGYKGRFCGRLFLKEDEAKLAVECGLVGMMLGCGGEGAGEEGGKPTLAKIVRGIASGAVRAHCERRERMIQELEAALASQQLATRQAAHRMAAENQAIRAQLAALAKSQQQAPAATPQHPAARPGPTAAATPAVGMATHAAPAVAAPAAAPTPAAAALPPAHSIAMSAASAASAAAKLAAAKAVPIAAPSATPQLALPLMLASPAEAAFQFAAAVAPPSAPPPAVAPVFRMPLPRLPSAFASPVATVLPPPAAATPATNGSGVIQGASPAMQQHLLALAAMQAQVAAQQAKAQQMAQQAVPRGALLGAPSGAPSFAASPRSAFAPVPRSGSLTSGLPRPIAAVGVPPVALGRS